MIKDALTEIGISELVIRIKAKSFAKKIIYKTN